jgi:HK97 family phage portal protein
VGIIRNAVSTIARNLGLTDTRMISWLGGGPTYSGEVVSPRTSMQIGTVYACVRLISQTIATLPCHFYQADEDGRGTLARDHPLYDMLHDQPNADMTAVTFWEAVVACILLWGNAYIEIERLGTRVVAIAPMVPDRLTLRKNADKSVTYFYSWAGEIRELQEEQVMHIKGFTLDGMHGMSIVGQARETLGISLAADKSAASFFRNGMKPSMVFKIDKWLDENRRKRFEEETKEKLVGAINTGGFALLEGGMTADAISIKPEDAQLLATRAFSVEEVCRWFGVQPVMIGHMEKSTAWGTGLEQMNLWFLTYTLRPLLKSIEQAIRMSLLKPGEKKLYYAEFNVDALLRADSAGRAALMTAYADHGLRTRNELRALDNVAPIEGGDDLTVQSNLIPIQLLGKEASFRIEKPFDPFTPATPPGATPLPHTPVPPPALPPPPPKPPQKPS